MFLLTSQINNISVREGTNYSKSKKLVKLNQQAFYEYNSLGFIFLILSDIIFLYVF